MKTASDRRFRARPGLVTGLLATVVAGGGCGRTEPTARLVGTVTIGGGVPEEPLMVVVENLQRGVSAAAAVAADGRFEVLTAPGRGVPEGTYRAALITPPRPIGDIADGLKPGQSSLPDSSGIPTRLRSIETSGLTVEVRRPETRFEIAVPAGPQRSINQGVE